MVDLVIVESPAKAKTLSRILGPGYTVEASYGHIRDLPESADEIPAGLKKEPWARLGVNVAKNFEPVYVVSDDKKKYVKRLKEALGPARRLLLATDEDREGESISWHVLEVLKPKIPVERIAFHEITEEAIRHAVANPRALNEDLVRAQESRRIVDRLFGYELSPLLWKKVRAGLSAGRVQSVAVRLLVMRERERRAFRSAGFWDVEATFEEGGTRFTARLARVGDQRVATGQDFDAATGALAGGSKALWLRQQSDVDALIGQWRKPWQVLSVEEKPFTRKPSPPFTTSSLQQEANRKLGFSAKHTMRLAQRLYEGVDLGGGSVGLITYMRTDSTTLSNKALGDAERLVRELYGAAYTAGARRYSTTAKGAQEAHEAIRPTELTRTPEQVARHLSRDEARLYELIWKRTLASQMTDARLRSTTVEILAPGASGRDGVFVASGKAIEFPGFLRAYVEGSDDPAAELADQETVLPLLRAKSPLDPRRVDPKGRETQPPARYTEASLVKKLEAEGIGRPSTYASILDTIQQRGYCRKSGNALVPTFTAMAVTELLERHFADYVDLGFTARMEQELDDVAAGSLDWKQQLHNFWFGHDGAAGLETRIASEGDRIDYPAIDIGTHPETGDVIVVKVGRYGPYLQSGDARASLPDDLAPADLSAAEAATLLERAEKGAEPVGHAPDGTPVFLASGRFGPYVQLGEGDGTSKPKRASLPKGFPVEEVTLELALIWLSLPRTLGSDPATGEEVIAAAGRFGPFVKRGDEFRSVGAEDSVYTISLTRALELLAAPKVGRGRGARTAPAALRELGSDPAGKPIKLFDGRYGPYVSDGETNASLPRGADPAGLSLEAALALLEARRAAGPSKKAKRARTTKTTTKATGTKRGTTKRGAPKKSS